MEPSTVPNPPRRTVLLASGILVLGTLAAYHNSFGGPFVFDDGDSIRDNPTIRHLWPLWAVLFPPGNSTVHDRPALNLSFALNHAISGNSTWSYHALNLLIHLAAGLTLFGLVRRTLLQPIFGGKFGGCALPVAFLSALLWMLHPVQTQSVTYLAQRAESMMGLFYLLTVYCFIGGAEFGPGRVPGPNSSRVQGIWFGLSWVACLLGMATKETMATAPLMVALYDRTFVNGGFREAWRRHRWHYAALGATWLVFIPQVRAGLSRDSTSGFDIGVPFWAYARTQFHAVAHYLRIAFWPSHLRLYYERSGSIDYAHPPGAGEVLSYALLLLPLAAGTVYALRRRPAIGFAGAWFFGILAPTSLVPGTSDIMADRRLYLPLAALAVLLVAAVYGWAGRRSVPALLLLAAALGYATERRNRIFASELALWREQVAARADDPLAHLNLGAAWDDAGRPDAAIVEYNQALELNSDYVDAWLRRGIALAHEGHAAESVMDFEQGIALARGQPADARCLPYLETDLGLELIDAGRIIEGIGHLREALRLNPDFAPAKDALERIEALRR